jgi:pyruvate dehydrogenase E2 component (dihydrolipoamide acetyltransferase)
MPTEITMPKLSDTMDQGTILRWFKRPGERVEVGDVLAEVETDKADMEVEADHSGTLSEIRVPEGAAAAVGAVIATLSDDAAATGASPEQAPVKAPEPEAPPAANGNAVPPPAVGSTVPPPSAAHVAPPTPGGAAISKAKPPAPPAGRQGVSQQRLAVAKQMMTSKREVPHFYVTAEIDMSEAARLRAALAATDTFPERITFTHLLIRALAVTLPRHPRVNASWSEGDITYHEDVNLGVAVAVADGLIAPVLRGVQRLSLREIARAATDLVEKAQAGRGDHLTGGTFTLSNMGMLDIEEFSAVIIPPQAAILAVGAIKERPVVRRGQLAVAQTMRVTLSADHRVLNGVEAARFLEALKQVLENPLALLLGTE